MKLLLITCVLLFAQTLSAQSNLTGKQYERYTAVAKTFLKKIVNAKKYDTSYPGEVGSNHEMAYATIVTNETMFSTYIHYVCTATDTIITRFVMNARTFSDRAVYAAIERVELKNKVLQYRVMTESADPDPWITLSTDNAIVKTDWLIQQIWEKVLYF